MRRLLLVPFLLLLLLAPGAQAADGLPGDTTGLADTTPIAAYRGHLVFSRADGKGGFQLVQRVGDGPVVPVGVPSRSVPFDVDVGPTPSGGVLAVYSRCTTEPPALVAGASFNTAPEYQLGKGCDIFKADLATGTETRFTAVNSKKGSEYWPTYWKGRIGFARVYDFKPAYPYLYVKTIASNKPSARMPGGARNVCFEGRCTDGTRSNPSELELYGTRLAFRWVYAGNGEGLSEEIRIDTVGGGHRRLDESSGGSMTEIRVGWPSFDAGQLFWTRACFGNTSGCRGGRARLVQSSYTPPIRELAAADPRSLFSFERDGGQSTFLLSSNQLGCQSSPPGPPTPLCRITTTRPEFSPRN